MQPRLPDDWRDCLEEPAVRDAQKNVIGVLRWDFARHIELEGESRLGVMLREAPPASVLPLLDIHEGKEARGRMRIGFEAYLRHPTFPAAHWVTILGPQVSGHLIGRITTDARAALLRLAFAHRKHLLEREMPACIAGRSCLGLLECQRRLDEIEENYRATLHRLYSKS